MNNLACTRSGCVRTEGRSIGVRLRLLAFTAATIAVHFPCGAADGSLHIAGPSDFKVLARDFEGGEGPSLLPDGTLLVTAGPNELLAISPDGAKEVAVAGIAAVGTAPSRDDLHVVYAARMDVSRVTGPPGSPLKPRPADSPAPPGAILRVDLASKTITTLYSEIQGQPLIGPNKLVIDDFGDLWFTDVLEGSLYWARGDGSQIRRMASLPVAHGIAWSPDHQTLYVSSETELVAYRLRGRGALAMDGATARARVVSKLNPDWNVDGIRTEASGNIVMACWGEGLIVLSPAGRLLSQLKFPGLEITNLVFGGPDRRTLYLTAHTPGPIRGHNSGQILAVKWPRSGAAL